ncbi:MAG: hypothetical protein U5J78_02755 [Parasphingorhabdus sp.]|nr:hypothetical protein [Parasphingorhabdus sp.]
MDAAWGQLADRAENQARVDVEDRIGGLSDLAQIFRSAMGGLETHLINAFDDRLDQYFDG